MYWWSEIARTNCDAARRGGQPSPRGQCRAGGVRAETGREDDGATGRQLRAVTAQTDMPQERVSLGHDHKIAIQNSPVPRARRQEHRKDSHVVLPGSTPERDYPPRPPHPQGSTAARCCDVVRCDIPQRSQHSQRRPDGVVGQTEHRAVDGVGVGIRFSDQVLILGEEGGSVGAHCFADFERLGQA